MTVGQLSYLIRVEFVPYGMYHCCGSGTLIPDPSFSIPEPGPTRLRIPDPGPTRFRIPDPHKRFKVFLTQNPAPKLSKKLFVTFIPDSHFCTSRIRIFIHPRSRIQESKEQRIPDPDPQHRYGTYLNCPSSLSCRRWERTNQPQQRTIVHSSEKLKTYNHCSKYGYVFCEYYLCVC